MYINVAMTMRGLLIYFGVGTVVGVGTFDGELENVPTLFLVRLSLVLLWVFWYFCGFFGTFVVVLVRLSVFGTFVGIGTFDGVTHVHSKHKSSLSKSL